MNFSKISTKLIMGFLTVSLFISVTLGLVSYYFSSDALESQIKTDYQTQSQNIIDKVDRFYFERYGDVQAFANNNLAVNVMNDPNYLPSLNSFINVMVDKYGIYHVMLVLDKNGNVKAANTKSILKPKIESQELIGRNFSNAQWFKDAVSTDDKTTYESEPQKFDFVNSLIGSDIYTIAFAATIRDRAGNVIGVWVNFSEFTDIMTDMISANMNSAKTNKLESYNILVLNKDGQSIYNSTNPKDLTVKDYKSSDVFRVVSKSDFGSTLENYDNKDYFVGYALSKGYSVYKGLNWRVLVKVTTDEALVPVYKLTKTIIIVSFIVLILSILFSWYVSKNITGGINLIVGEITNITKNILAGKLATRGSEDKVPFDFKPIINQVNNLIMAFVRPIEITKDAVNQLSRISDGSLPKPIEDEFEGDFNEIKDSINSLIGKLNGFVLEINDMYDHQGKGDSDARINESHFDGLYLTMAQGVNSMVNNLISLNSKIVSVSLEYANGNFDASLERLPGKQKIINESLDKVQENLKAVETEIFHLISQANNGNLDVRANDKKFAGGWANMISGVNKLVDELLSPINDAVQVLEEMAEGNLSTSMKGQYKGDHAKLKKAINTTLELMPLKEAMHVLEKLSAGDLTVEMTGDYKGDSLQLKNSMNATIDSMNQLLSQVANTVDEVTRGAMQVSDASTALSQGATEQAASLEEITSSMAEIGNKTNANATSAQIASNLTYSSRDSAINGNKEMSELNLSMNEITQSSREISKIIKVIDEIAFQTNLLALNAAVEAARAGRHGKGFAVVAEEVRNLAARSAKAAKETAEMIENSIRMVEKGANLANKTSDVLEKIKDSVVSAADLVGDIAKSSNDQAMAISQISEGLHQIDKVTQTNTASSEESASASEELSGQAAHLKSMLSQFKLKRSINQLDSFSQAKHLLADNPNFTFVDSYSYASEEDYKKSSKRLEANSKNENWISLEDDDFGRY